MTMSHAARRKTRQALERFFGQKEYYCLEPEDFQTSVDGRARPGVGCVH